jgi:hypothetical protein
MRIQVSSVAALTAILAGCGDHIPYGPPRHETQAIDLDKSEMLRVELNLGVGELYLTGGSPKLLEADFTYENPLAKPLVDYHASSFRGDLRISQPRGVRGGGVHGGDYRWDVRLNNTRATDLVAHLGVGEVHMEAGSLNLRSLEIHMGVGELTLDLRGMPKRSFDVQIHGGVGEAVVHLPRSVGIQARATGGIGDISVEGLEKRGSYWYNPSHDHDPVTIHVDAKGGVGEIRLVAE